MTEFVCCGGHWVNLAQVAEVEPTGTGSVIVRFASRDTTEIHPPHNAALLDRLAALNDLRRMLAESAAHADREMAEALVEVGP